MKAYILREPGLFGMGEAPRPAPLGNEVLVRVEAAGICGSDIPRIYHAGAYSYPLVPGHEFSGVAVEPGDGVEEAWSGKRVGVFPLVPCGECGPCMKREYEMCRSYSYIGSRRDGAFAEYVRVPVWNLVELPEHVSYEQAALLEPMAVAVHAMRRAGLRPEDRVAVCGLGAIGLFLLMFLKERGIRDILALGNKEMQREKAEALGIPGEAYFDIRTGRADGWLRSKGSAGEREVFFDCVGRSEVVAQAVANTAPGGKVILVGNPVSDMRLDRQTCWRILRNQMTLSGTWNSSFYHSGEDDWSYVLERLKEGRIRPEEMISHRFVLDELIHGFELMRDKKEEYVKVMAFVR